MESHRRRTEQNTPRWKSRDFCFLLSFSSFLPLLPLCFRHFFIFSHPSLSNLTAHFSLLLHQPTLLAQRGLIHGPLLDMAHSTVSWLWLDYVHSGNATSPGGLKLSWQPPLNDRATNWRLGVLGRGRRGRSAGTDRGVTQTSPAGLQGFSTARYADSQPLSLCTQVNNTRRSGSDVNLIPEQWGRVTYPSLRLMCDKLHWHKKGELILHLISQILSPWATFRFTTNIFIILMLFRSSSLHGLSVKLLVI